MPWSEWTLLTLAYLFLQTLSPLLLHHLNYPLYLRSSFRPSPSRCLPSLHIPTRTLSSLSLGSFPCDFLACLRLLKPILTILLHTPRIMSRNLHTPTAAENVFPSPALPTKSVIDLETASASRVSPCPSSSLCLRNPHQQSTLTSTLPFPRTHACTQAALDTHQKAANPNARTTKHGRTTSVSAKTLLQSISRESA